MLAEDNIATSAKVTSVSPTVVTVLSPGEKDGGLSAGAIAARQRQRERGDDLELQPAVFDSRGQRHALIDRESRGRGEPVELPPPQ